MGDILNPDQRRSVKIILHMFEENLRQADSWLTGAQVHGILYRRKLNLPLEQRLAARQQIKAALEQLAAIAKEIGLVPEEEDPAGLIRGELSLSWANLLDTQSSKLKRFGDVDPELERVLDPALLRLAQIALELASVFKDNNSTE